MIQLKKGHTATGFVVEHATGWPIPGVEVYALPRPYSADRVGYVNAFGKTDAKGRFNFDILDEYEYLLNTRSGKTMNQEVVIRGGQSIPVTVRIKLSD